jgi:hypothetical protein
MEGAETGLAESKQDVSISFSLAERKKPRRRKGRGLDRRTLRANLNALSNPRFWTPA